MEKQLIEEAMQAIENSYAPISNFNVGVALLTRSGKIYKGCNIENSSISATNCAERTAFFKAISEGEKDFEAIAIIGGKNKVYDELCFPCGVCRQVMNEFCKDDFKIIIAKSQEEFEVHELKQLLPHGFKL